MSAHRAAAYKAHDDAMNSPRVLVPLKLGVLNVFFSEEIAEQWQSERSKGNPLWCGAELEIPYIPIKYSQAV